MTLTQFYKSKRWAEFLDVLANERVDADGYLWCGRCGAPIVAKYDRIGHHKIPLTEENVNDAAVALNPDNVVFVHHRCHNAIHERFGFECPKRVYLVYGPPCAGKTTWVTSVAGKDDLIVDIDNIWQMISVNPRYDKPARLRGNVFAVRDNLLDQVKTRFGKWRNAYIIGGFSLASERERLCEQLGAEPIFVEESRAVCTSRALERSEQWVTFVDEWFDTFVE